MCGICCVLVRSTEGLKIWREILQEDVMTKRRGPDKTCMCHVPLEDHSSLLGLGCVLHLRGKLTEQPLQDLRGNLLFWNGEIFGGLEVSEGENDTKILLDELSKSDQESHILSTMAKIEGPWAFVYYQKNTHKLWFGRDMFGRRSLLWHLPVTAEDTFILSSTQTSVKEKESKELPSIGLYCVDINKSQKGLNITIFPRKFAVWPGSFDVVSQSNVKQFISFDENTVTFSVAKAVLPTPIPALNKIVPSPDDLISVIKTNSSSEEASLLNGIEQQEFIKKLEHSDHQLNRVAEQFIDVMKTAVRLRVYNQCDLKMNHDANNHYEVVGSNLCDNSSGSAELDVVNETNEQSRDFFRIQVEGHSSDQQLAEASEENHAKVAILFSGGIDSSVIAALVDKCLPASEPVDLINVAFEQQAKANPNSKKGKNKVELSEEERWNVPDRTTGSIALSELKPTRKWNFVNVNVTLEELKMVRSDRVRHLVYPLETVLDDSIGCAVWFAARGQGFLRRADGTKVPYISKAKVILCGMGADEQFAGYSRHRSKFSEGSWQGLVDEIEMEIRRISARNLGRDDRVISDHGKESRFPFLDENVVQFLSSLPLHLKVNLALPRGLGEKLMLRVAATKLGLTRTAVFPKRAIQFGSRIAKMESSKEKATDICQRLVDL